MVSGPCAFLSFSELRVVLNSAFLKGLIGDAVNSMSELSGCGYAVFQKQLSVKNSKLRCLDASLGDSSSFISSGVKYFPVKTFWDMPKGLYSLLWNLIHAAVLVDRALRL